MIGSFMQLRYIENDLNTDTKNKYVVKKWNKHKCISILCAKLSNTNLVYKSI